MKNKSIGILFVVVLVGALIGGYLGGLFGAKGEVSSTGNIMKNPPIGSDCKTTTVTGDFVDVGVMFSNKTNCTYGGDNNYDPFVNGWVRLSRPWASDITLTEECALTEPNKLTELTCRGEPYNDMAAIWGTCTLGCVNGACVRAKNVVVCNNPVQN